ncbi:DUF3329 domain-containing protein [Vagococcus acidifermentans]|uniref:Uncharacterized protein n=1 Tax=Vagococcus acidifermentans TaxID=564710 RepID=A0A430APS9_9ENTE|nr:DUF6056 family protein [Vagococcus acidifermentans]RSU10066.1 hypothetical protein CBF27_11105 [Vagococcus acidifermentans]
MNLTRKKLTKILPIIVVICFFYLLNHYTPLLVDDFNYAFIFGTEERVRSISDIFISQYNHYFIQNGRIVVHFMAQLFILLGKDVFNVVNTFVLVIYVFLLLWHIQGRLKYSPYLFMVVSFLIWFLIPAFGQTMLWLDGSTNYLWGACIILTSMLPYRLYKGTSKKWVAFITPVLTFLGGWTNENTSGALILMLILFLCIWKCRGIKIPTWSIIGIISAVIGFILMIGAPSNRVRADMIASSPLINRIWYVIGGLIEDFGIFIVIFCILFVLVINGNLKSELLKNMTIEPCIFFTGALASYMAMALPTYFPDRAKFGAYSLMLIAVLSIGNLAVKNHVMQKRFLLTTILICTIFFSHSFIDAFVDIKRTYNLWDERIAYFMRMYDEGKEDISVKVIFPKNTHNALHGLVDLRSDPNKSPNSYTARYWGFKSITGIFDE